MNPQTAKKIGSRKAMVYSTVSIILAFIIMTLLAGGNVLWIIHWNYKINIVFGVAILYLLAYLFGKKAGVEILIKKKDSENVGMKYTIVTLLITSMSIGWIGFIQEGIEPHDTFWSSFEDYIFKPFFWVSIIGIIPAIVIGVIFGNAIKKKNVLQQ